MYEAGLHTLFPGKWQRGPSENSYAVYCFIIYLWCTWTTWTASILLNILYFIFYDSECLTVNKLEIKWNFQNTINISEIFPARDSSSLEWWQRQFVNYLFHMKLSGKHFVALCLRGSQSNSSQLWLANFTRVSGELLSDRGAAASILQTDVGNFHLFLITPCAKGITALVLRA